MKQMKRVRINAGNVGLVFRNGDYTKVITQGTHWLGFGNRVTLYDLTKPFVAPIALELLLKDQMLEAMLNVVEVQDNELVIVYENKNFNAINAMMSPKSLVYMSIRFLNFRV